MLLDMKMLLGEDESLSDNVLEFILEDTVNMVLSYCRLEILPYQLYGLIPQIAVSVLRTLGDRAGIESVTEGDRRIEYHTEILADYCARLKPFVNCRAKLPSEVQSNEE